MKLSVVTVCLNSRDTIADAVQSIHLQTHADVEHIVVDGGSDDGTLDILNNYNAGISTLISEPDPGLYYAMNKGIEAETGEYLGFLNSDDVYHHDHVLEQIVSALVDQAAAVHADLVYVEQKNLSRIARHWNSKPYKLGMFEAGWHTAPPTLFVKTDLLKEIGGFNIRYRDHADFHLMVRLFV